MKMGKMSGVLQRLAQRFTGTQGGKKAKPRKRKARRRSHSRLAKALDKLLK